MSSLDEKENPASVRSLERMTTREEDPFRSVIDVATPIASLTLEIERSRRERDDPATRTAIFVHLSSFRSLYIT
jgi:hypothetical protein